MGGLTVKDVRKETITLLRSLVRGRALTKGFGFNMQVQSSRVSAEERSCLEGVCAVRFKARDTLLHIEFHITIISIAQIIWH